MKIGEPCCLCRPEHGACRVNDGHGTGQSETLRLLTLRLRILLWHALMRLAGDGEQIAVQRHLRDANHPGGGPARQGVVVEQLPDGVMSKNSADFCGRLKA